ncbi:323_t:CDS:2 [Ambispora leptoticha]|uniref:323_t:CDS:1 n=1 Tax=Ambispora leptoticha TaxID=144679 RepID=A0A9N9CQ27_9GLOM|nr:323_t:CDS:2 [Ambispora leptoticha]
MSNIDDDDTDYYSQNNKNNDSSDSLPSLPSFSSTSKSTSLIAEEEKVKQKNSTINGYSSSSSFTKQKG